MRLYSHRGAYPHNGDIPLYGGIPPFGWGGCPDHLLVCLPTASKYRKFSHPSEQGKLGELQGQLHGRKRIPRLLGNPLHVQLDELIHLHAADRVQDLHHIGDAPHLEIRDVRAQHAVATHGHGDHQILRDTGRGTLVRLLPILAVAPLRLPIDAPALQRPVGLAPLVLGAAHQAVHGAVAPDGLLPLQRDHDLQHQLVQAAIRLCVSALGEFVERVQEAFGELHTDLQSNRRALRVWVVVFERPPGPRHITTYWHDSGGRRHVTAALAGPSEAALMSGSRCSSPRSCRRRRGGQCHGRGSERGNGKGDLKLGRARQAISLGQLQMLLCPRAAVRLTSRHHKNGTRSRRPCGHGGRHNHNGHAAGALHDS
mmetsp:Transcript_42031/g.120174  ORF Transcript_42031/g.120174 Transcript_42031/m.120174 type:complete len:369 (+) Transcript_42031:206-1312(+)